MKRLSIGLGWLLLAAAGWAEGGDQRFGLQQRSIAHGEYALVFDAGTGTFPLVGELIDCTNEPTDFVVRTRGTFDFFVGICDDLGDRPCAGRLTFLAEGCLGVTDGEQVGRIRSDYGRNPLRICYDEFLTGECTAFEEVASGHSMTQQRGLLTDGVARGVLHQSAVDTIVRSKSFEFAGRKVRVRKGTSVSEATIELPDPEGGGCDAFLNPCGAASSAVSLGRR